MVVENRLSFLTMAIIATLVSVANLSVLVAQDDAKRSDLKTELGCGNVSSSGKCPNWRRN